MSTDAFPSWAILEPFVFRRDDDDSFPDETKAPVRASGITSWDAPFRVAFSFVEPPRVSRLYAQLRGFPGPDEEEPLAILKTHRHLVLLRVGTVLRDFSTVQDFFIYSAYNPSSLHRLPPCSEPYIKDYKPRAAHLLSYAKDHKGVERRLLAVRSMGLLCPGEGEFAVAELRLSTRGKKLHADIFFLKSAAVAGPEPKWRSVRVPILHSGYPKDIRDLLFWQTDDVIPIDRWLCWIDYSRGMLFCDVFGEPKPTVSFLRFPLDKVPDSYNRNITHSRMYRGVSAIDTDDGRALKFVHVARSDDIGYGALKPGASFTITCYTLNLDSSMAPLGRMRWIKDSMATSDQLLWTPSAHSRDEFPHDIVMYPQVNIDRPHVVHFLISSYEQYVLKKTWLVSIDMNTRTVESSSQYTNGEKDRGTVDLDLTRERSSNPLPFLTCELSKYLRPSRKRKDME